MSPEAFEGNTVTTRADAWSFACTISEMASGRPPWQGTSMSAICFKVTASREVPTIPACLPAAVRALLSRCFAFEAAQRPCFDEIVAVFAGDWGVDATGVSPTPSAGAGVGEAERAQLVALRAEREEWQAERREGAAKRAEDAQLVARLQGTVGEHQEVNEQLQGKLVLILDTMKSQQQQQAQQQGQQQAGGGGGGGPRSGYAEFPDDMALVDCQEALQQVMRQKNTAKEMLKQEAGRVTALAEELEQLRVVTRSLRAAAGDKDRTIALQAARLSAARPPSLQRVPPLSPHVAAHAPAPQPHAEEGDCGRTASWGEENYSSTSDDSVSPLLADQFGLADQWGSAGALAYQHSQGSDRAITRPESNGETRMSQATTPSVSAQVSWEMRGSRGSVGKGEAPPSKPSAFSPGLLTRVGLLPAPHQLPRDYREHSNY